MEKRLWKGICRYCEHYWANEAALMRQKEANRMKAISVVVKSGRSSTENVTSKGLEIAVKENKMPKDVLFF